MSKSFTHSADNLQSFFSQAGRGFYIPYYQRNYSWDEENAEKLVSDIFSGIKRTLTKPNNSIFLGTVILHDEKNVEVGVHTDTPNLLTKISNVVDGQQRITSLAMLACVFSRCIANVVAELGSITVDEFQRLANELDNEQPEIQEFFSVEIKKKGAEPRPKPLIIRAGDVTSNPVSDQWTMAGARTNFYRSNTSGFISDFIEEKNLYNIRKDERISNIDGESKNGGFSTLIEPSTSHHELWNVGSVVILGRTNTVKHPTVANGIAARSASKPSTSGLTPCTTIAT